MWPSPRLSVAANSGEDKWLDRGIMNSVKTLKRQLTDLTCQVSYVASLTSATHPWSVIPNLFRDPLELLVLLGEILKQVQDDAPNGAPKPEASL